MGEKLGNGIKTEEELGELTKTLRKAILEAALGGEITEHLGYEKHSVDGNGSGNSRNYVSFTWCVIACVSCPGKTTRRSLAN